MKLHERSITIQGKDLVAALLTAGAQLVDKEPTCFLVGDIESRKWNFRPTTDRGVPVHKLIDAYEQERDPAREDWSTRHKEALDTLTDEQLFSLAMMAMEWRERVDDTEKARRGDAAIAPTMRSRLVLGPNIPKHKEERLLRAAGL